MLPTISVLTALAWKGGVILLAAHGAALLLRRRSAAERHLVWAASLMALLAVPVLERPAPAVVVLASPAANSAEIDTGTGVASASTVAAAPNAASMLWSAGFGLIVCYQLAGLAQLSLRRRSAIPFAAVILRELKQQLDIRRDVRVYISPRTAMPMTWGVLRPTIMFPAAAADWSDDRLRLVLLHELTHAQRFDFLTQLLAGAACAAFWYNPLTWTAMAGMRREREKACDDAVLRTGEKAADYACHLLEIAAAGRAQRIPALAVPMAQASELESRIRAALNSRLPRQSPRASTKAAFAAFSVIAVLSLVVIKTHAQPNAGQLFGSVLDISGAAVPQAVVIVSSGNKKEIAHSGPDGRYAFASLPAGPYGVEVRKPGFALLSRKDVAVKVGEAQKLDLTLEMGRVQETVEVVGKGTRPAPLPPAGTPQRIRIGGNVQATKLVYMPKPQYPQNLQQQGVEGTVLLEGVISTDGSLLSLRSLNSLVHPELGQAAIDAVKQWRYQPTLLNGKPVEIITTITVNYRLAP
ncbi:MAG TPA: M56 family metallopeptidase [Bryobacteraceae bacterium]|nr:M56 family metallopeptidase [Bryobacteraceae bacterium]